MKPFDKPAIDMQAMGFPLSWKEDPFWQLLD